MVDIYTKAVLTVIAIALAVIALQNASPTVMAQAGCGIAVPCYVQVVQNGPLWVSGDFPVSPRR